MKKTLLAGLAAVGLALTTSPFANATIITGVTASAPGVTQSYGAATFTSIDAGNGADPGNSMNTLTLNATIEAGYANGTPFSWTIDFVDSDADINANGNTKYLVTVNLTNNRVHPISPVTFSLSDPVETFNFTSLLPVGPAVPTGPNSFISPSSPAPTSTYNTVNFNGLMAGVPTLHYGGLNGGGGEFYTGQTATFTFHLDLADYVVATNNGIVVGSFVLSMVANPEPTSLALAGLAMSAGGFGAFRRRRKTKAAAEALMNPTVEA